jgi:hypothetical protein
VLMALRDGLAVEAERLHADAGGMTIGRHPPPYRRRRGDRPDVPLTAPGTSDPAGLRRWLREWQVREGRCQPRTHRERALAETGAQERAKLARVRYSDRVSLLPGLLPPR